MHPLLTHASHQLARRALSEPDDDNNWQLVLEKISGLGWATLTLTLVAGIVVYGLVSITLHIIFTLAAIESPEQAVVVPVVNAPVNPPPYKDATSPTDEDVPPALVAGPAGDPEAVLVTAKPITASIRSTVRHLHSIGGFRARWRGFWMSVMWFLAFTLTNNLFSAILFFLGAFGPAIAGLLARIVMARWELGWTLIVISQPSPKPWYRRTPPTNTWKNVWAATALNQLFALVAAAIPIVCFYASDLADKFGFDRAEDKFANSDMFKLFALFALWIISYWVLIIPANVALNRVQASLLPPEEEAIVHFDRTFGGRVVSTADGGSGVLSFKQAWRSFSGEARIRILKLVVKTVAIQLAIATLFGLALAAELCYFVLPAINHVEPPDDSL